MLCSCCLRCCLCAVGLFCLSLFAYAKCCVHRGRVFEFSVLPEELLPPEIPVVVPHVSLSIVAELAAEVGAMLREESAIDTASGSFTHRVASALARPGTWLMVDLADVEDFSELAKLLLRRVRSDEVSTQSPSRFFLFSSAETSTVPPRILRLCLCMQSVARFFGFQEDGNSARFGDLPARCADVSEASSPRSPLSVRRSRLLSSMTNSMRPSARSPTPSLLQEQRKGISLARIP